MFDSVLVAFDIAHEEHGIKILKRARALCSENAVLKVIYVGEEIPSYMEYAIPQDVIDEGVEDTRKRLKKLVAEHDHGAQIIVSRGRPHIEILAFAEKMNADLILTASHNPGIQDYLIGSTAARIVRHAQCSVLIDRSNVH
jgi:universal stress protein F